MYGVLYGVRSTSVAQEISPVSIEDAPTRYVSVVLDPSPFHSGPLLIPVEFPRVFLFLHQPSAAAAATLGQNDVNPRQGSPVAKVWLFAGALLVGDDSTRCGYSRSGRRMLNYGAHSTEYI